MANIKELEENIRLVSQVLFSRSGGPGGQNVNKVNTRVQLRIPIEELTVLNPDQRARLFKKLETRINDEGILQVVCNETRDQHRNREIAMVKAVQWIENALKVPKARKKTRPTAASKVRKRKEKDQRKQVKALRRTPKED